MNHTISDQLNEYPLKTTNSGLNIIGFGGGGGGGGRFRIKNEIAKISILSKMFEANLLMQGRI